jgi:maltose phosphorylase
MNPLSDLVKKDPWKVIQSGFSAMHNKKYESLMSIGNGHMGQRANFEETFTGSTHSGSYMAGVYYPDKTRVGWWKNGYPEYFAKVINSTNWIGISVELNGLPLDLNNAEVIEFTRELDMQHGLLNREFIASLPNHVKVHVKTSRFCSMEMREIGAIRYEIKILEGNGKLKLEPYLDGNVMNKDSNYDMKFWEEVAKASANDEAYLEVKTKKLDFHFGSAMKFELTKNGETTKFESQSREDKKYIGREVSLAFEIGDVFIIDKIVSNCTSRDYSLNEINSKCNQQVNSAFHLGFNRLKENHSAKWKHIWDDCDIIIEGDIESQQAIRFNIFQLYQTYSGHDPRLNIGPKGFTGEKYGGSTYWDTEAYCLPFYLATTDQEIARNLLVYRHRHLGRAIENAEKLGFKDGAALYPMVTMNGEECHNEWEITFEEIHRNGAIAYAVFNYVNYTGDYSYLATHGFEVLVGIARFWAQRVNWSSHKNQYVILGVTGPNEYENNVNNNWYTNYIAAWCLRYTIEAADLMQKRFPKELSECCEALKLDLTKAKQEWEEKASKMYFPSIEGTKIFLQQEGYLDKEDITTADLPLTERPLNQKWSWDRILRSPFIKQADVLQGFYFFEHHFDVSALKENFDYYEPRTVHESSLSPCIHSVLASKLNYDQKAYEMFLRTSRLDLDDYNREVDEGLHITSMAGTWISLVQGFGGMRTYAGHLELWPKLPRQWKSYHFSIVYRGSRISVHCKSDQTLISASTNLTLMVYGKSVALIANVPQHFKCP